MKMSLPTHRSGRVALSLLAVTGLIAALIGVRLFAVAEAPPPRFEIGTTTQPTFTIGPIEGLTTTWHWAPRSTSIPLGTIAEFFQPAPPNATVNWTGATEVARDDQGSTALCPLVLPGITMVQVQVIPADGGDAISSQSRFNVVDIGIDQITVSAIDVWVDPIEIDEDLPQDEINEQTMGYFFGPSIAALRDLGDGQYRTSVNRMVQMSVEVDPPGFAPLIEWRFDGQAIDAPPAANADILVIDPAAGMGSSEQRWLPDIGNHLVEVGPLLNPQQIEIETYSVTITSHTSEQDTVPEGEPIVFIAETDPPGYENDITWLSSTKFGTAEPILGEGPIFIAEFNDTWGIDENGDPFQWLGVKADNTFFNQDGKCDCEVCEKCVDGECVDLNGGIEEGAEGFPYDHEAFADCINLPTAPALKDCLVTPDGGGGTSASFGLGGSPAIPADFFAPGSDPFVGTIVLVGDPAAPGIPECPGADTVIQRSASPFVVCDPPGGPPVTVDIEIVALNLVSVDPIIVTFNGGQDPEEWDVALDLSSVPAPVGSLTATKTHCNGGTFSSVLNVNARYTFTKVEDPEEDRVLDAGEVGFDPVTLTSDATPWIHGAFIDIPTLDFIAGLEDPNPTQLGCADNDNDGFNEICDCDDNDPDVNPDAVEICNDGIDNDCDGDTDCDDADCDGDPDCP